MAIHCQYLGLEQSLKNPLPRDRCGSTYPKHPMAVCQSGYAAQISRTLTPLTALWPEVTGELLIIFLQRQKEETKRAG